jgi:hypothetical protein
VQRPQGGVLDATVVVTSRPNADRSLDRSITRHHHDQTDRAVIVEDGPGKGAPAGAPFRLRPWLVVLASSIIVCAAAVYLTLTLHNPTPAAERPQAPASSGGIGAEEAKSRGVYAADGDGSIHARSSTVIGHVGRPVTLRFDINNRGSVPAIYTVTLDADTPEFNGRGTTATVAGNSTTETSVVLETSGLTPGIYSVTARLTSNLIDIDSLSMAEVEVHLVP